MAESRLLRLFPRFRGREGRVAALGFAGLLLLAALVQLGLARLEGAAERPLTGDEKRYVAVATSWAAGEPAELDPLWPPGYPATLALLLGRGGSLLWIIVLQSLAVFAGGVALSAVARQTGATPAFSWLAGALLVLDPEVAAFARFFWPEALHLALLLTALLLAIRCMAGDGAGRQRLRFVLLGAVAGMAIALKSLLLPLLPLLALPVLRASSRRKRVAHGLLVALPLVLVLAPVVHFQRVHNGVRGLGSSARFNLWVGLTDRAAHSLKDDRTWSEYLAYRAGGSDFAERQRAITRRIVEHVESGGLAAVLAGQFPRQYFRLFDRESYFGAMLPPAGRLFLAGEGYRAAPSFLARLFGSAERVLYIALLAAGPFGLARLVRERRPGAPWILGLLAYQLVLFYFVHVQSRYRLTLLPVLILGAAWAAQTLWRRGRTGELPVSGLDLAVGGGGAALLLYFAFGAP
jgi:hypothetical protein